LVVLFHVDLRIPLKNSTLALYLPKWLPGALAYNGYEAVFIFFVPRVPMRRRHLPLPCNARMSSSNMYKTLTIPVLACALLLSSSAARATGGPPMITDDPGTPGDGHWEINLAAVSSKAGGISDYQWPLLDLNFGVGERIQLKLEMPRLVQRDGDGAQRSGAGNALAGVKWRFHDAGEYSWQTSSYPQVELAAARTGGARGGLANEGSSYLLPFEFAHAYPGFDVNIEVGRWFRAGGHTDSWIGGVVLTHEVKKGVELVAELHEDAPLHRAQAQSQVQTVLNLGGRYDLSEHFTLLMSAGRDLRASHAQVAYFGLRMRY
jgi:hypothetical protein